MEKPKPVEKKGEDGSFVKEALIGGIFGSAADKILTEIVDLMGFENHEENINTNHIAHDEVIQHPEDHHQDQHHEQNENILVDLNNDGTADMVGVDNDHDGAFDYLAKDTNADGVVDTYFVDTNHDGNLDTAMVDMNHDGTAESSEQIQLFDAHYQTQDHVEHHDDHIAANDHVSTDEFDPNADVKEWT